MLVKTAVKEQRDGARQPAAVSAQETTKGQSMGLGNWFMCQELWTLSYKCGKRMKLKVCLLIVV